MKKINAIFLALISLAFISCASDEVEIPVWDYEIVKNKD